MSDEAARSDVGAGAVALVTGAAHGIGREVAHQLARAGMCVVLTARRSADARAAAGRIGAESLHVGLDVSDPGSVRAAVAAVTERWGRLDVLVNNAAAPPDRTETPTRTDLAHAARAFEVTLFGTWRTTQAFLPLLRQSAHPRIVNVSSGAGSHTDERYGMSLLGGSAAAHAVGKAAVNAFTVTLAAELADTPILVNAVCPGVTATVPGADEALGARPVAQSAPGVVWAATLPDTGPRGGFFRDGEPLGW